MPHRTGHRARPAVSQDAGPAPATMISPRQEPVPTDAHQGGPNGLGPDAGCLEFRPDGEAVIGEQACPAQDDLGAVHLAAGAEAGQCGETGDGAGGGIPLSVAAAVMAAATGCSEAASTAPGATSTSAEVTLAPGDDVDDSHAGLGDGAGSCRAGTACRHPAGAAVLLPAWDPVNRQPGSGHDGVRFGDLDVVVAAVAVVSAACSAAGRPGSPGPSARCGRCPRSSCRHRQGTPETARSWSSRRAAAPHAAAARRAAAGCSCRRRTSRTPGRCRAGPSLVGCSTPRHRRPTCCRSVGASRAKEPTSTRPWDLVGVGG